MNNQENKYANINAVTVIELNKILNWIKDNNGYIAQLGDIKIRYEGIKEDTINGKRECYYVIRKVKENK